MISRKIVFKKTNAKHERAGVFFPIKWPTVLPAGIRGPAEENNVIRAIAPILNGRI